MILRRVDANELWQSGVAARTPYGSRAFIELNASKVDEVVCYGLYDGKDKLRLALATGRSRRADGSQVWQAPFSAPFAEVLYTRPQCLETCMDFAGQLAGLCTGSDDGSRMAIRLAPDCYDPVMLPRLKGAFAACCKSAYCDFNYHYRLMPDFDFVAKLSASARNHYNRACRAGFVSTAGVPLERAYVVIALNRAEHDYPLAMSLDALRAMEQIVPVDTFVLSLGDVDVAAAIVYRISASIAQVIYWGDVAGYSAVRPMNLLAAEVMGHYHQAGYTVVDIGPASSAGVPDPGLCTFKESLGCELSFKPTFRYWDD